jgi:hypothetical protein
VPAVEVLAVEVLAVDVTVPVEVATSIHPRLKVQGAGEIIGAFGGRATRLETCFAA